MYKDNPQTAYKQELKEKILTSSMHEFLIHGVKSVRMDDIANSLGISKRTLYEIYSNKEELLLEPSSTSLSSSTSARWVIFPALPLCSSQTFTNMHR